MITRRKNDKGIGKYMFGNNSNLHNHSWNSCDYIVVDFYNSRNQMFFG